MRLETLIARAATIANRAARQRRDRIIADADLPPGVRIETGVSGIILIGWRLRLRMINDTRLRNIARKGR